MLNYQFPIDDINLVRSYDIETIEKAFNYIVGDTSLTFDFSQGGCQQRSHMISLILTHKFDIHHFKVWLFSPASLYEFDERSLFMQDKNKLSPDNMVHWNYHTAPVIRWFDGVKYNLMVIDPSIDHSNPILIDNWLQQIGNSQISKYTFLYPEKYFFNCKYNDLSQLTNVFDGSFFEFVNPAKDNLVMEKGLAVNDMAKSIYNNYIKNLLLNIETLNEHKTQDLKDIFGNATALDLLFAQNLSGNSDNTSYRYVLANYPAIIKEAKAIFHERLIFWTTFTNDLYLQKRTVEV